MCAYIFRKFDLQEMIVTRPIASCCQLLFIIYCSACSFKIECLSLSLFVHTDEENPPSLPISHKFYSISAILQHNSFISIFASRHNNCTYSNSNSYFFFFHFILSLRYSFRLFIVHSSFSTGVKNRNQHFFSYLKSKQKIEV